eukprot:1155514-Amphidinium_carterae.1
MALARAAWMEVATPQSRNVEHHLQCQDICGFCPSSRCAACDQHAVVVFVRLLDVLSCAKSWSPMPFHGPRISPEP